MKAFIAGDNEDIAGSYISLLEPETLPSQNTHRHDPAVYHNRNNFINIFKIGGIGNTWKLLAYNNSNIRQGRNLGLHNLKARHIS